MTGTGFVSSESIEDLSGELTYSYNYEQFGNVGTYKITPSGVTSNNYEITFADGTLTVNAKDITVTADALSKTYGEADKEIPVLSDTPATGDDSNIMLWSGMLCICALGLVAILIERKRRTAK